MSQLKEILIYGFKFIIWAFLEAVFIDVRIVIFWQAETQIVKDSIKNISYKIEKCWRNFKLSSQVVKKQPFLFACEVTRPCQITNFCSKENFNFVDMG
jgi:hypothetical protein